MSKTEFPETFRPLWDDLRSEIVWLHGRWIIYRQLYGTNEKRINLLNETAGTFFYVIQFILLDDVALSLSRLTDPPQTTSQANAVLEQLLQHPEVQAHAALVSDLEQRLVNLKEKCAPFRKIRNKRIAHRDLRIALKIATSPLPGISREMVEEALAEVRGFMNAIELFFIDSQTFYEDFAMTADGEALISYLKQGVAFEKAEREDLVPWDYLSTTEYGDA